MPRAALTAARESVGAGYAVAQQAPPALRAPLLDQVQNAFMSGLHAGSYVAAGVCLIGVLGALSLPGPSPRGAPHADPP